MLSYRNAGQLGHQLSEMMRVCIPCIVQSRHRSSCQPVKRRLCGGLRIHVTAENDDKSHNSRIIAVGHIQLSQDKPVKCANTTRCDLVVVLPPARVRTRKSQIWYHILTKHSGFSNFHAQGKCRWLSVILLLSRYLHEQYDETTP
jgi:hypothetical protein